MGKKRSKNLNKFKVNKRTALRLLPVAVFIVVCAGTAAFLFHGHGQNGSLQISQVKPKPAAKTETNVTPIQPTQPTTVSTPAPSSTTTTTTAPTQSQDTCDEQAAADARTKAKAAHDYHVAHYTPDESYWEDQYAQGKITHEQLLEHERWDSFVFDDDLHQIDQGLISQLTALGCPITFPLY